MLQSGSEKNVHMNLALELIPQAALGFFFFRFIDNDDEEEELSF